MATIPRGEAFLLEWRLTKPNAETGVAEPLDEDTPVSAWLSAIFKGDPITPESVTPLTRRAREVREDRRVLWFGILDSGDVTAALVGIATGGSIYEVVEISVTQPDGAVVPERKSRVLTVVD